MGSSDTDPGLNAMRNSSESSQEKEGKEEEPKKKKKKLDRLAAAHRPVRPRYQWPRCEEKQHKTAFIERKDFIETENSHSYNLMQYRYLHFP